VFATTDFAGQPTTIEETGALRHAHFSAIAEIVSTLRPAIQRDGGDIVLVSIEGDIVRVRLSGACIHCAQAGQTLGGIRREIIRQLGHPYRVLPSLDD